MAATAFNYTATLWTRLLNEISHEDIYIDVTKFPFKECPLSMQLGDKEAIDQAPQFTREQWHL